jgi:hypothetical protein
MMTNKDAPMDDEAALKDELGNFRRGPTFDEFGTRTVGPPNIWGLSNESKSKATMSTSSDDYQIEILKGSIDSNSPKVPTSHSLKRIFDIDEMTVYTVTNDEMAPPSSSIPPALRSVDTLPMMSHLSVQTSNVVFDDNSVRTGISTRSMATEIISNRFSRTAVPSTENDYSIPLPHGEQCQQSNPLEGSLSSIVITDCNSSSTSNMESRPRRERFPPERQQRRRRRSHEFHSRIDNNGYAITEEEMQLIWRNAGKCIKCGTVTTHQKEAYGPFKVFRRMAPLTVEGLSYKGFCLRCYDVPELRILLVEPDIPLNLLRDDSSMASLQSLRDFDDIQETQISNLKKNSSGGISIPLRLQMCCAVALLILIGGMTTIGILFTSKPEPWVSKSPSMAPTPVPPTAVPTMSPTSWEWTLSSKVEADYASFGYAIDLSADGSVLAVASPKFESEKGRFDVYLKIDTNDEKKWARVDPVTGTPHVGAYGNVWMGMGMKLSGDGLSVAVGSPGHDYGLVQVYHINKLTPMLTTKGSPIYGPTLNSDFGYAVALNFDGSRLFVGAPNHAASNTELYGLARAFDFDPISEKWIQIGEDILGDASGKRFGHSIDTNDVGDIVVIGAPGDSRILLHAGAISLYKLSESKSWNTFSTSTNGGGKVEANMGSVVATSKDAFVVATNNDDNSNPDGLENAGLVQVFGLEDTGGILGTVGFPISGTKSNERFGHDIDISGSGEIIVASSENIGRDAGAVRVFSFYQGKYQMVGGENIGSRIGTCQSLGKGPSVAVAAKTLQFAVGYECLESDGGNRSRAEIHIFDYFSVDINGESDAG